MLNRDCLVTIFEYSFDKISDFQKLRLVSKEFHKAASILWFRPFPLIYAPNSFINVKYCSICRGTPNKDKTIPYGNLPRPIYIYCDNFQCTRTVIRNMVEQARKQNKEILMKEAVMEYGMCPRSNGSYSECMFMRGWMWSSGHVRCLMGNYFKDVAINKIAEKYKLKYKILKL